MEKDHDKIKLFRTMIGMAEDAYSLKRLENIKDYDMELELGKDALYTSSGGILYNKGQLLTADYNENESKILIRDIEGIIIDVLYSKKEIQSNNKRNNIYKNWNYIEKP